MLENIYDAIKILALPSDQEDGWTKLARQHEKDAKRELRKFMYNKSITWDGDNNTISIGRDFVITLVEKGDKNE